MGIIKRLRLLIFLLLLTAVCTPAAAQPKPDLRRYSDVDSQLDAWLRYCDLFLGYEGYPEDYPGLIRASKEGIAIAPPWKFVKLAQFHFFVGAGYQSLGSNDSALRYYETAKAFAFRAQDTLELVRILDREMAVLGELGKGAEKREAVALLNKIATLNRKDAVQDLVNSVLASLHRDNNDFANALTYYQASIAIIRKKKRLSATDSVHMATELIAVGEIETELAKPLMSVNHWHEAEPYLVTYAEGTAQLYQDFIGTFLGINKLDSAVGYYRKLKDVVAAHPEFKIQLAYANLNFSNFFLERNGIKQAYVHADRAYELAKISGSAYCMMQANYMQGKLALATQKWQQAVDYLLPAIEVAKDQDKQSCVELESMAAKAYEGLANYKAAFSHELLYATLADTLGAEKNRNEVARILTETESRYEAVARRQQIALLNKDNKLAQAKLSATRRQQWLAIAGLLLFAGLAVTLGFSYRNKRRSAGLLDAKNKELSHLNTSLDAANQTKTRLFGILSHDLRAPVSQLAQYLQLQHSQPMLLKPEQMAQYSNRVRLGIHSLLETMEDIIIWSKSQMDGFEPIATPLRLNVVVRNIVSLLQPLAESRNVSVSDEVPAIVLSADGNVLQIIIRNLLQNALQQCPEGGNVQLDASQHEDAVLLRITDCGPGMPEAIAELLEGRRSSKTDSSSHGLGLQLVAELSKRAGIRISVEKSQPSGTTVTLHLNG